MPIFTSECNNASCATRGKVWERLAKSYEAYISDVPKCPECGVVMEPLISAPNVVWARPLAFYEDKKINEQQKGFGSGDTHVAWRKRSSRRADGKPEKVVIDSIQAQREFCKAEGLVTGAELGNIEATEDGKWGPGGPTAVGNKGSWI